MVNLCVVNVFNSIHRYSVCLVIFQKHVHIIYVCTY